MTRNRIEALAEALSSGKKQFAEIMAAVSEGEDGPAFAVEEVYDLRPDEDAPVGTEGEQMDLFTMPGSTLAREEAPGEISRIAAGDNLEYMIWLLQEKHMAGKIQLIYVDPPFFTNARYQSSVQITDEEGNRSPVLKVGAYEDTWGHDLKAYLEMLAVRFFVMRELLAETGSLWVHLDWHGSHYVKMLLDEIFGPEHFVNEVAWVYKSGGASKHSFSRKHDTLLFYSKTKYYKFNPLREKSYNREGKPYRFKGVEEFEDEHGWYTMVNMKDVWNIDMVGRTSAERKGYATQKPEKLLERIVEACSDEGDLCADFFAGTGTLGAVCARTGRTWIMCDSGDAAIGQQILRMSEHRLPFLVERPVKGAAAEEGPRTGVQVSLDGGRISLQQYQPDLTQVQERDREIVSNYINRNSLDLISFWSADTAFDGSVHTCRQLLTKDAEAVIHSSRGLQGALSIVGYDLFGGRFEWRGDLPSKL